MTFDAEQATQDYINSLGTQALEKAAAYTSGNHWLMLGGLLVTVLVTWLIVRSGLLHRIAATLSNRGFFLRTFSICAGFLVLSGIIELPWSIYTGCGERHCTGEQVQSLADFLGKVV